METVQLIRDEKILLENNTNNPDFNQALQDLLNTSEPALHEYILNEFSLRHTAWIGLVNKKNTDTAIVIETGLGAIVASLSSVFKKVYALYLESDTMDFVSKRVDSKNVSHILLNDFLMRTVVNSERTLFVAYNDEGSREFNKICINILNKKNIRYYYCINSVRLSCFFHKNLKAVKSTQKNTGQAIYHIEGSIRDPFKLTSRENKKNQFGELKYFVYRLYIMLSNKYVAITNLCFNESFFCAVANDLFGKDSYKIRDIYFIKPNGALLVVFFSGKEYMLRMTSDELGKRRLLSNNYALEELKKFGCNYCPEIYKELSTVNYNCSVEERISGRNVNSDDLNTRQKRIMVYEQAASKLMNIHIQSMSRKNIDNEMYTKVIGNSLSKSIDNMSNKYREILDNIDKYLRSCLLDKTLPLVLSHGDFSVDNLMICNDNITGIIDWEYSASNRLPFVDLIFFFCSVYKKINDTNIIRAMQEVIVDNCVDPEVLSYSNIYCDSLGLNKDYIKPLSLMCIIDFIAYRLENNSLIECHEMFDKNFGSILISIDKYIGIENKI